MEHHIDGATLSLAWGLPFVGVLLSIALLPLLAPGFWHHHFGKVAAFWSAAFLLPFAVLHGPGAAVFELLHVLLGEYLPFIILLFALFVVAGGIWVSGTLVGTPRANTGLLAFGTLIASVVGTTGASMLLIRPLIRANHERRIKVHTFVFFIFLVSNIGGALTPLGDPPLFIGFLQGVEFGWTVSHLFAPMLVAALPLLAAYYLLDRRQWRREGGHLAHRHSPQIRIQGAQNILLLGGVVGAVLLSGLWKPGIDITLGGIAMPLQGLARDGILIALAWLSWRTTKRAVRVENAFTWTPIQEVAMLFAAIFITMVPVLAILKAGPDGALSAPSHLVRDAAGQPIDLMFFWLTGLLSSFLDNAPTYLVFFNLAGGDAQHLMGPAASTLLAISAGAVFMGANTYIGNAPNFMVRSICEENGIAMPSFFGFMAWSTLCLWPVYVAISFLFFRH